MIDDQVPPAAEPPAPHTGPDAVTEPPVWRYVIGLAAAVVGLLPWLITGIRLPLQHLWATPSLPEEMPLALLPFSQYAVVEIPALLVVGGAVAGAVARWRIPSGLGSVAVGLLAVQVFAVVQTAVTVSAGLAPRTESTTYLVGLVALSGVSVAVAVGTMVLIARAPRAGVLVGVTAVALLLGTWVGALVAGPFGVPSDAAMVVIRQTRWVAPVLIGGAIAWAGLRTVGRAVAALGSLLALWLVPPLLTAVTSAVGSRILAGHLADMLEYGVGVFRMAATTPSLVVPPLLVAVGVAAAGLLLRGVRRRHPSP